MEELELTPDLEDEVIRLGGRRGLRGLYDRITRAIRIYGPGLLDSPSPSWWQSQNWDYDRHIERHSLHDDETDT